MISCPSCSTAQPEANDFCSACGSPLTSKVPETQDFSPHPGENQRQSEVVDTRFSPGMLIADRYRIVSMIGKGGMGEVYRADDLTLEQQVALKFISPDVARDPERMLRFRKEVTSARGVSHKNVCRVYDLAEHEGQLFLTMEYVDGEDLSALLKRIGRLPEAKATDIACQLSSALAAVHEQGLLHRDLKPANIMLDSSGQVRLMDFGLAAVGTQVADVRAGTPAYMAPEQWNGREVTVRSDLFALGLVLYELFTGVRAFPATTRHDRQLWNTDVNPSRPSEHVKGLDPKVDDIILRCLQVSPDQRPRSAYEVLAELPGADPLRKAAAEGVTPSPKMVADSGGRGDIPVWVGLLFLLAVPACLVLIAFLSENTMIYRLVPWKYSHAQLNKKAVEVLKAVGCDAPAVDSYSYFKNDVDYLFEIDRNDASVNRWDQLRKSRPAATFFAYRQATKPFVLGNPPLGPELDGFFISEKEPPPIQPGMASVRLDLHGRLLRLSIVPLPPTSEDPPKEDSRWWDPLFDAAKFDENEFQVQTSQPTLEIPRMVDDLRAWNGKLQGRSDIDIQIVAGSYRGKPVYFEIIPDYRSEQLKENRELDDFFTFFLGITTLAIALILTVRNIALRRVDWYRTGILAAVPPISMFLMWLLSAHFSSIPGSLGQLLVGFGIGLLYTLSVCTLYLALEPALRRRWPWRITAWNRMLSGRIRDPMVGRDVLIGLTLGMIPPLFRRLSILSAQWLGIPSEAPLPFVGPISFDVLGPPCPLSSTLFGVLNTPVMTPLYFLAIGFIFSLVLRLPWLAWSALGALIIFMYGTSLSPSVVGNMWMLFWCALIVSAHLFVLLRMGLLAYSGFLITAMLLFTLPITSDLTAWYAWHGIVGGLFLTALATYGFFTATRGQMKFREGFFRDEKSMGG